MSNARFSILQSRAVSDERISNAQFRTLAAIGTFGDKDGWCFPKLQTIAVLLHKSKQAVSMDIKSLADLGYVEVTPKYRPDGSQTYNLYRLIFDTPLSSPEPPLTQAEPGLSSELNGGLSSELNGGLSSEVDALTPQLTTQLTPHSYAQPDQFETVDFINRLIGATTIPHSTSLPREVVIEKVNAIIRAHGFEEGVRLAQQALKVWTSRRGKNGRTYNRTNLAFLDWVIFGIPDDGSKPVKLSFAEEIALEKKKAGIE